MSALIQDTWGQTQRWLVHLRRDRMSLVLGILQPLILLTLVGPLLNHVVNDAEALREQMRQRFHTTDYLTFLFSGIAVFTILVNSILGGIPIVFDRETGFMDKVLVAPVSRLSIVAARFLYVILYSLIQVGLISVVAVLLGVRPAAPLLALVVLVGYGTLLCAGLSVLSLAFAFVFPHHSIFFAITGFLLTPLLVLSPTFVSLDVMPRYMAMVAWLNPMTHAIEPIRAAFFAQSASEWLTPARGASALALLVFDALCFAFAVRTIRRRVEP
ncbi:MAG: ABC transporter permease [Planctomycetota bacterium]